MEFKARTQKLKADRGQLMILTVLLLGGVIMGVASVVSSLIVYKVRQATDVTDSAKAIFAADAGREFELFRAYKTADLSVTSCPSFSNGARFHTEVTYDSSGLLTLFSKGGGVSNNRVWHEFFSAASSSIATSSYPIKCDDSGCYNSDSSPNGDYPKYCF